MQPANQSKPNFNPEKSLFLSIAEWLEDAILSDIYMEESQIPSTTEISVKYNINPATALKGINRLVESKILYKRRGLGMFVAEGAKQKLLEQRRQKFLKDFIEPLISEAKRLAIHTQELQNMIERGFNNSV